MIDNYDALTLGIYMKINAILESDADELEKQVGIVAILADMPLDDVLLLPLDDYASMAAQTAFLRVQPKPTEIPDGWRYGDLVPTQDFRKINTAQYVDFQSFCRKFPDAMPELLSVFMVPDGHAYNDGYDVAVVQERVKGMPLQDALGLAAFFFVRFSALIADSLTSWGAALKTVKDEEMKRTLAAKIAMVRELLQTAGVGLPT